MPENGEKGRKMESDKQSMWGILELMGHVRLAGRITEEERFGGKMGRIDIPSGEGFVTQFFNASSIYRLTPTPREIALAEWAKSAARILTEIKAVGPFTPGPSFMSPLEKCKQMATEALDALPKEERNAMKEETRRKKLNAKLHGLRAELAAELEEIVPGQSVTAQRLAFIIESLVETKLALDRPAPAPETPDARG